MSFKIFAIDNDTTIPYDLLQLADPSQQQIEEYLPNSLCFIAQQNTITIGVLVLHPLSDTTLEIKNIAVQTNEQGKGFGKKILQFAFEYSIKRNYKTVRICTGNSSIHQLALYQQLGFDIIGINRNFFTTHYPTPIIENDIPCRHLIILEKTIA